VQKRIALSYLVLMRPGTGLFMLVRRFPPGPSVRCVLARTGQVAVRLQDNANFRPTSRPPSEPLDHGLGEHVEWQVGGTAGVRVGAAHAEAAEELNPDQSGRWGRVTS
jgi:hypothetical protein